jgi:hypothetical protein
VSLSHSTSMVMASKKEGLISTPGGRSRAGSLFFSSPQEHGIAAILAHTSPGRHAAGFLHMSC